MRAGPSRRQATLISISRRQSERWVLDRIVDFVEILRQIVVQLRKRPSRVLLRVYRLRHLADIARHLRVAGEVMNETRVRDPEQALAHGPESRFCRRTSFFRAFVTSQQSFEIDAVKLAPSIEYDDLRQSPVAAHAFSQNHHAGTITG